MRETGEFTKAEQERRMLHKMTDRKDIEEQLRNSGMRKELILLWREGALRLNNSHIYL